MIVTPWGFAVAALALGALAAGIALAPGPTAREAPPMDSDPSDRRRHEEAADLLGPGHPMYDT
ncbi:hypothetical protein N7925_19360 [Streptomyces sp. CA-278952]|uniref:hypothetical protein n=1 Tax=Streptomyces sp. CA-278952 TaxID=2980556 RepID=UPI002368A48C|nr:hypothetical protein [Streptomyces sp. CA-278952]WDG30337.1 hypothetical protein N7925_19360 [Streptomyces sp. CA-278952]